MTDSYSPHSSVLLWLRKCKGTPCVPHSVELGCGQTLQLTLTARYSQLRPHIDDWWNSFTSASVSIVSQHEICNDLSMYRAFLGSDGESIQSSYGSILLPAPPSFLHLSSNALTMVWHGPPVYAYYLARWWLLGERWTGRTGGSWSGSSDRIDSWWQKNYLFA